MIKNRYSKPLISLCLITYNQPDAVLRILTSIKSEPLKNVEIVVIDDSENNHTKKLFNNFQLKTNINYIKGKKRGVDNALLLALKEAKGEFVWWIGDDDIVKGGVTKVLNVIKYKSDINFIWANYQLNNSSEKGINFHRSCFFKSKNELLLNAGLGLGFISATIFRREIAIKNLNYAYKYVGSAFVSLYIILCVITAPGRLFFLKGPIVICHPTLSITAKKQVVGLDGVINNWAFDVFAVNFSKILRSFSDEFSKPIIYKTIKRAFGQTWRGILVAYVGGWDTPAGKKLKIIKYFWMFPESWLAFVLFLFPKKIHIGLYKLYKFFVKKKY